MLVTPPTGGLVGNSNYSLYENCNPLSGVSVTIDITEEMIADPINDPPANEGMAFQLNCITPKGSAVTWQQYIFVLWWKTQELRWWVNNWDDDGAFINAGYQMDVLPSSLPGQYSAFPAGYRLTIALGNDSSDNVDSVTFTVADPAGRLVAESVVELLSLTDQAHLSSIIGIGLFIVGYANGEYTLLSKGAGQITYRAANALVPINTYPECGEVPLGTAESSNVTYGGLDSAAGPTIVQTFSHKQYVQRQPPQPPIFRRL